MPQGQFPTILAGQALSAGLLQSMQPVNAWKTADTPRATNITVANDPDLTVPVAANAWYNVLAFIDYEGGTQGASDIKWQWAVPSGSTMRYTGTYVSTGGTLQAGVSFPATPANSAGSNGAGNHRTINITGSLQTGGTAGSLTLQWAQNTSNATATIVHALSNLTLIRYQ